MGLDLFSLMVFEDKHFPSSDLQTHCTTYLKTNHFENNGKEKKKPKKLHDITKVLQQEGRVG